MQPTEHVIEVGGITLRLEMKGRGSKRSVKRVMACHKSAGGYAEVDVTGLALSFRELGEYVALEVIRMEQ